MPNHANAGVDDIDRLTVGSTITASASIHTILSKPICKAERTNGIFPQPALFSARLASMHQ